MANIAIFRINYKSDFILTLNSDAGWMTPFCIKFWTGAPSQAYFVGFDGTTYTHCAPVDGEPTKLLVQFDDHHLPIGDLKFQIGYHFTVADFPTSVEDEVLNQASVIIEVDDAPAQVMLDFNGETAPEIEFSLPAYANEAQRIANEDARIAAEQQRIANEESRIAAETIRQQNEQQRIDHETARVNEFATLKSQSQAATRDANDAATLANQKAQLAADKAALADDAATLANQKAQLAADKAALANDAAQLADEKAALAQQKAEYAQTQGGYAKDQGDYAKNQGDYAKEQGDTAQADHERAEADHGIAVDDHTQAGNDHTRAEADHGIAVDDHTQAGNDHTRAESDHGIAADDHTQAGNDHTCAESDHGIAVDDHTQAGADHTRAESDHTRAESDHAAVEVYVDSLGVFDLSKHNAVGGVLATYADLSAALTALNALDSKYKYGGMSFKFVQSSDNKYVQYRCILDEFTTDVTKWQKQGAEVEVVQENTSASNGEGTILINGVEKGRYANADKLIGLVGIASSVAASGVAAVGDIFYITTQKKFFRCTNWTGNYSTSDYVEIPPYKGAIYVYNNVLYTWDFTNSELIPYVTIEQDPYLEGFDLSVNGETIKGVLGGYQKGLYYQGTNVDSNFYSTVSDTDNIFVQIVKNGCRHISKIRYVAKTGTIYFYKVYAPSIGNGLKVSKTLITSVVNESSEAKTIKTIDVDIDLLENEYLGISGDFWYKNTSGNTFYFNASTNTIGGTSNSQAFAIMTISDVNGLSQLLEKRESQFLKTYGENGVGTANSTPGYVFITEDSQQNYPTIVRYIEVELETNTPTEIYKVTLNGDNSTVELLGSAKGSGIVLIPLNVTLLPNQRIGIGNRIRYKNSGADERYSYKLLSSSGGAVTQQPAGSIICYKLYGIIPDTTKKDTTIIVDANGNGDYTNIHDAIKGTYGMDSASNPIHIKVMPGIYNEPTLPFAEESSYCNDRFLSIVGVDKENCIIRNDKGYYNGSSSGVDNYGDNAPIKVNGNVYIANLTIISTDDEAESEDNVYHRSYCIHTDAWANQNTTLEIHNCILKNDHAPCVGFGIPKNNTLKITDCELYTQLYNVSDWASNGAVICGHDKRGQASTDIDEHLFIKDCVIKSDNTNAVVFINNKSGLADCIFINNAVDVPSGMGIDLDTGTSIDKLSYGNALVAMNHSS